MRKQLVITRGLIKPFKDTRIGMIDMEAWQQTEKIMLEQKQISGSGCRGKGYQKTLLDSLPLMLYAGQSTPFLENKNPAGTEPSEWESLCDGCGLCCLQKLEDRKTGRIDYTNRILLPAGHQTLPLPFL